MAYQIVWTESATADLEQIVAFISQDNTPAARDLGTTIIEHIQQVSQFPRSGRVVPEKDEERLRELILTHTALSTR